MFGIAGGGTVFGGSQVIEGGGTASNTTIANGGTLVVSAGGLADPTTILGGGLEIISARGSDRGALLSGGEQDVYGNAGGATIFADSQVIESGAARATPLLRAAARSMCSVAVRPIRRGFRPGVRRPSATDAGARVSGGAQLVYGFATRTIVFTGAQLVGPGGTASGTTILSASRITLLSGATLDVTSGYTLSSYALGKGIVVLGMKLAGFVAATNVRPPMMRAGAPNDGTASRSRPIWCCKPLLSWKILTGAQSPARFGFKPNAQVTPLRG